MSTLSRTDDIGHTKSLVVPLKLNGIKFIGYERSIRPYHHHIA